MIEQTTVRSANELAEERTELAAQRTALAAGRSLMAWVRTGLSMIGFGFTIYKFLQGFTSQIRPNTARNAGLFLIGLGTVSVLFGCIDYWQFGRGLRRMGAPAMRTFPLFMAALVGLIGVLLFVGALTRLV